MTEQKALEYLKDANRNNQMVGILPKSDIGKCLVNALEEVQQYRAIGTPEECRAAVDKQTAKKPCKENTIWHCPECGEVIYWDTDYGQQKVRYCPDCGKKVNWSDEQ